MRRTRPAILGSGGRWVFVSDLIRIEIHRLGEMSSVYDTAAGVDQKRRLRIIVRYFNIRRLAPSSRPVLEDRRGERRIVLELVWTTKEQAARGDMRARHLT